MRLLLDDGGGVDGVSSQVGVGHRLVDGGNNGGNTGNIVVRAVVRSVVSRGVEEGRIGISVTLGKSVIPQGLDSATLSGDAVVGGVETGLGNDSGGSSVAVGVGVGVSVGVGKEDLGVSFGFPLVQTADGNGGSGVGISVGVVDSWAGPPGVVGGVVGGVGGGVEEGWIGFRLGQAKRGDGENYDLKFKDKIFVINFASKAFREIAMPLPPVPCLLLHDCSEQRSFSFCNSPGTSC